MEGLEEEAQRLDQDLKALQADVESGLHSLQATESTSIQAIEAGSKTVGVPLGGVSMKAMG